MRKRSSPPVPGSAPALIREEGLQQDTEYSVLLHEIREMISSTRNRVAYGVNRETVLLYWNIGSRIHQEVLQKDRGEYGKRIVETLSGQLLHEYGRGFSRANVFSMVRFAELYHDPGIIQTLSGQLSWSHFVELIKIDNDLQRDFYTQMCRIERWSVRLLKAKIQGMLFERTALSRKPEELARQELEVLRTEDQMSPDLVFRDPYFLDFLGLSDTYSEKDIESGIIREIERFILEMGSDFSFIARQKRITIDAEDYYIDLLFFHRRLRCLIAIDLKLGRFQAADKGQMELYLRWLDKYERVPGEESPMGLILCAGKSDEHVELLGLSDSGIRVAEYLTELPPRELLEAKLKSAMERAQNAVRK
ncbi:PDDEXK nuclease domain-containing protein [Methanospirillum purgamenti]|nr:PDDEXK nuclease domain-containing protein [Methanospirillum hungatei]